MFTWAKSGDPTIEFMQAFLSETNHEHDLPPHTVRREEDGDLPAELETRVRWLVHDWDDVPEFSL